MYRAIARNKRNTVFIILLFLVLIGALGWLAAYIYNSYTILVVVLIGAVLYALFQYYLASSQALSMSGAVPIQKADNPRLWNIVENLSITTATPMPAVYIVNDPAPQGRYLARLLCFAPELVEQFHRQFGQFAAVPPVQGCAGLAADAGFEECFLRAMAALESEASSQALREHRALEVLLLLAEAGIVFAPPGELGWAERVRRLVSASPQADWTLERIAAAFATSASTLQRRLAQEGESVSQCLRDVRLETGLVLLQSSTLQVSEIAARCGYESHSRFSAAFRERFGFAPSHLRP